MSTIEELKEANAKLRKEIEEINSMPPVSVKEIAEEVAALIEENEELQRIKAETVLSRVEG